MTFNEPFESIDAARLQSLIDNGVPESATLEFKRQSYGPKDGKELAKDVSALANTLGGDLFIGIEEKGGVAAALTPLPVDEADKEVLRLESIIKTTIDPALVGMRMQRIRATSGGDGGEGAGGEGVAGNGDGPSGSGDGGQTEGVVIHIRVPRSFTPPHRVTAQGSNRFFGRHSAGVSELTMPDLRRLFGQERDMFDRARAFIGERFMKVQAGDTPVPVKQTGSGLVMHLVPLMDFAQGRQIEVAKLRESGVQLPPLEAHGFNSRINLDGFINFRSGAECEGYTQLFRSGVIEAFQSDVFWDPKGDGAKLVASSSFGGALEQALRFYTAALSKLGVLTPILVKIQLFGASRTELALPNSRSFHAKRFYQNEVLALPEAVLSELGVPAQLSTVLRDQLDFLWNAYGYEKCSFFDEEGN